MTRAERLRCIGQRIACFRRRRHWTQQELAEKIHRSPGTVSRIERGCYNGTLPLDILIDMADALHVRLFLVFITEEDIFQLLKGNLTSWAIEP